MASQRQKSRPPLQDAVLSLRRDLGMTQQQFSEAMEVTVVTVCRWETVRPPSGFSLLRLGVFAKQLGKDKIAEVFLNAFFGSRSTGLGSLLNPLDLGAHPTGLAAVLNRPDQGAHLPLQAPSSHGAEAVLAELRQASDIPEAARAYREILLALRRAQLLLMKMSQSGIRVEGMGTIENRKYLVEDLDRELRALDFKELPNEDKQTKKR